MLDINIKISKTLEEKFIKLIDLYHAYISQALRSAITSMPSQGIPVASIPLSDKERFEKEVAIGVIMANLEPEVKARAEGLFKGQLKDMLSRVWDLGVLKEAAKKKCSLIKKRRGSGTSLYIQYGDGVEEPIEEILIS